MSIEQRDQLGIGGGVALADDVGVELEVLAQAAFLLALVAEELGQGEPFDRLLVAPLVGGDHARQGGGHLRAQRHLALALVCEIVELPDDFLAALGGEELQRFEGRAVVFAKAVAPGHAAPLVEDVLARVGAPQVRLRQRLGIKIAKPGQDVP